MKVVKEIIDYLLAVCGLIFFIIPIVLLFVLASVDTGMFGFFSQKRIGKGGRVFNLYKLRTMRGIYDSFITTNKMEITKIGRILRKYKLDELPQIFNIIKGDMSWVGPRPDVSGYADQLKGDDRIILSVKPGITGPAQLKYKNEEEILSKVKDPKIYNDEVIWKDKIKINKEYVENWNMLTDFKYMLKTLYR